MWTLEKCHTEGERCCESHDANRIANRRDGFHGLPKREHRLKRHPTSGEECLIAIAAPPEVRQVLTTEIVWPAGVRRGSGIVWRSSQPTAKSSGHDAKPGRRLRRL